MDATSVSQYGCNAVLKKHKKKLYLNFMNYIFNKYRMYFRTVLKFVMQCTRMPLSPY